MFDYSINEMWKELSKAPCTLNLENFKFMHNMYKALKKLGTLNLFKLFIGDLKII